MAYVSVDIDLDEIDFDDLIEELSERLSQKSLDKLRQREIEWFKNIQEILSDHFKKEQIENVKIKTVEDEFRNCSLAQIEALCTPS